MTLFLLSIVIVTLLIGCFSLEKTMREDQSHIEKSNRLIRFINARYHHPDKDPIALSNWS
jgi:hypothetical protein